MSTQLIQAAKRALTTLESATSFMSKKARDQHPAVIAELRTAIQQAEAQQPATGEPVQADSSGHLRVIASLGAALRRLSFAAQTTGGTAGPDAELQSAIGQAEQALSLGGIGRVMFATTEPVGAREALERIASWSEHPAMLGVDYGSNGVRDYYRKIARDALTHPAPGVPEKLTVDPSGVSGSADEGYVAGWNACRAAITQADAKTDEPVQADSSEYLRVIASLDAECNSLAHQLNASNERNGMLRVALSDCSAELFAQCGDQSRAMSYVNAARTALAQNAPIAATPELVGQAPSVWNSIQIASWIGSQLMREPSTFERNAVCKFVRSLGRHPTLLKHSPKDTNLVPGVPDDVARDAISSVREQYRGTDWGKAAECVCDAIDDAMTAASPAPRSHHQDMS